MRVIGDSMSDVVYEAEEVRAYDGTQYNFIRSLKTGVDVSAYLLKPIIMKQFGLWQIEANV